MGVERSSTLARLLVVVILKGRENGIVVTYIYGVFQRVDTSTAEVSDCNDNRIFPANSDCRESWRELVTLFALVFAEMILAGGSLSLAGIGATVNGIDFGDLSDDTNSCDARNDARDTGWISWIFGAVERSGGSVEREVNPDK